MPRYVTLAKYSASGAAGIYGQGFGARRDALQKYMEGLGGRLTDFCYTPEDEYDVAVFYEFDEPVAPGKQIAHNMLSQSSGAYDKVTWLTLVSPDEVDAAHSSMPGFIAPGQS